MSLFTFEDICAGCKFAHWHSCPKCSGLPHFCHCEINAEYKIDFSSKGCKSSVKQFNKKRFTEEKTTEEESP